MKDIHIAVIDDARVARLVIMKMLGEEGFTKISEADDGDTGWDLINGGGIDIVFCDYNMPTMNGLELLKKVRANGATASLPFVMVSAERMEQDIERAKENGVTDYIVKPFGASRLKEIIEQHLS